MREAQFLILDFLFERNEQAILINNIYLRCTVDFKSTMYQNYYSVTSFLTKIEKILQISLNYNRIESINR